MKGVLFSAFSMSKTKTKFWDFFVQLSSLKYISLSLNSTSLKFSRVGFVQGDKYGSGFIVLFVNSQQHLLKMFSSSPAYVLSSLSNIK